MSNATTVLAAPTIEPEVVIPDFELEGCIGEGTFGRVYLARSKATGRYRAVKVVRRSRFQSEQPYEIEFAGLRRFEEVSREHEGFVDVLHVSRNDAAGYFCYVMELADDLDSARQCDPAHYTPRTIANELTRRGRLPPAECVRIGLALAAALVELRQRDLVHRDVNPRNIVFVRGAPKLADVGLVADVQSRPQPLIGTPDYMDPEVHGTPEGDLYSLGKVLYVMATGLEPKRWPDVPTDAMAGPELPVLRELQAIWRKACHPNRGRRYAHVGEVRSELLALQAGASVLRLKRFEQVVRWLRRYAVVALVLLASLGAGFYFSIRERRQAAELHQRQIGAFVAQGDHAVDSADSIGALSWFGEAWRLDDRKDNDHIHRIRLGAILERVPTLEQLWYQPRPPYQQEAWFPGEPNQIVMAEAHGKWQVYDLWRRPMHVLYPRSFGHGLPFERLSLSSRTKTAVSSARTQDLWLWDYEHGTVRSTFTRRGAELGPAAISPDGQRIAALSRKEDRRGELLMWSSATPEEEPRVLTSFATNELGAASLAFSPDSRLLLSSVQNRVQVWEVSSGGRVRQFTHADDPGVPIFSSTFSPDSRYAVTASWDRSARIWEVSTGREVARFMHEDGVWGAEFDSTGRHLVTAGLDSTARVWDWERRIPTQFLRHNAKVLRAAFSPQDRWLLTCTADDMVRVWGLPAPPAAVPAPGLLACAATRMLLVTNGGWALADRSGSVLRTLSVSNRSPASCWLAPDDRFLALAHASETGTNTEFRLQVYDAGGSSDAPIGQPFVVPADWDAPDIAVSAGGRWAAAFNGHTGVVWNVTSGKVVQRIPGGGHRAMFNPQGSLLAIGRSNLVEVRDLQAGAAPLARIELRTNAVVASLEWDPDGRRLITATTSSSFGALEAETWVARTGRRDGPPLAHRDGVLYAAFGHDGTRAVTCSEDFTAILWDPKTGRQLTPPLKHRGQVSYAVFSEQDRLVATSDSQVGVTLWHTETGERLAWLAVPLHRGGQRPWVRFGPDLATLVVRAGPAESYEWAIPYYRGSRETLLRGAQLLSAHRIDPTGGLIPHATEALRQLWLELGAWPPRDAAVTGE